VPNYDFSQLGVGGREIRIENDYKAWYDLMRRLNRLFELNFNLRDLEQKSQRLIAAVEEQLDKLAAKSPQIDVHEIMAQISQQFEERPFAPLEDDVLASRSPLYGRVTGLLKMNHVR